MKMKKRLENKFNNRGFSMTELLVAIAIMGVVSLTIYSFMIVGSQFYGKQASDADIQTEAQKIANTVTNLIIDCEANVAYEDSFPGASGNLTFGTMGDGTTGKGLEITNTDKRFLIYPKEENGLHNLYYLEQTAPANGVYGGYDEANAELLAQNVDSFDVDLSRLHGLGNGTNIISFTLVYKKGGRTYRGTYQVNLRNDITVSGDSTIVPPKDPDCSQVQVTPDDIIQVKGKLEPHIVNKPSLMNEFTAVARTNNLTPEQVDNLFNWSLDTSDASLNASSFIQRSPIDTNLHGKFYNALYSDSSNVLKQIKNNFDVYVIATANVPQLGTTTYKSGRATVKYVKINSFNLNPARGYSEDATGIKVNPNGTITTAVNVNGSYLQDSDDYARNFMHASFTLEYSLDNGVHWMPLTDGKHKEIAHIAAYTGQRVSLDRSKKVGTGCTIQLGKDATDKHLFRVTATDDWDDTYSDSFEFGVNKTPPPTDIDEMVRGVEINMNKYIEKIYDWYYGDDPEKKAYAQKLLNGGLLQNGRRLVSIQHIETTTASSFTGKNSQQETQKFFKIIEKDGTFYMYIDYDALEYSERSTLKLFYQYDKYFVDCMVTLTVYDPTMNQNVQMGPIIFKFQLQPCSITANVLNTGADGTKNIVMTKGSATDIPFHITGLNISRRNMIGFYYKDMSSGTAIWQNANMNQYNTLDLNKYLMVDYVTDVGNRYNLIQDGTFRLSAKSNTTVYPTEPITTRVTLNGMYVTLDSTDDNYMDSYQEINVYLANVEGRDVYVQGPRTANEEDWKYVDKNGTKKVVNPDGKTEVEIGSPNNVKVVFGKTTNANGNTSGYTMKLDNVDYYWNPSYNCWIAGTQ